jgi:hypothetical protein
MITISVNDFVKMMECLEQICSEYSGAKVVQEKYIPVFEKYEKIYYALGHKQ